MREEELLWQGALIGAVIVAGSKLIGMIGLCGMVCLARTETVYM